MAKSTAKQKKTYGVCKVEHLRPAPDEQWPKAINMIVTFEEAMKLHLALQHRLLDINKLNRASKAGKAAAVNLCLFTEDPRITVSPGKVK